MKKFMHACALLLCASGHARAIPLPKLSHISGVAGASLALYCLRQSPTVAKETQQELLAGSVAALLCLAFARTCVERQGEATRTALAQAGIGLLAPRQVKYRTFATRSLARLLGLGVLLSGRGLFDYLFIDNLVNKYACYALYMTQVAKRGVIGLAALEALYQGIARVRGDDVQWAALEVQKAAKQVREWLLREPPTCPICLEGAEEDNPLITYCSVPAHVGHELCWQGWFARKQDCPICRRSIADD